MQPTEGEVHETIRILEAFASRFGSRDSEDLVQEAFARAFESGISPDARPWLRTVIRHMAVDRARRTREIPYADPDGGRPLASSAAPDPEQAAITGEEMATLRQALGELPPRYREVLLAFVEEGRALPLVERFDTTPAATWTLLSRARARLREKLDYLAGAPAAIAARFQGWGEPVVTGGVAVGVAIGLVVSGSGPAEPASPDASPRPFAAASATVSAEPTPLPAPAPTPEPEPVPSTAPAPSPAPEAPVRHESTVCAPEEAGGSHLSAGLRIEEEGDDDSSLTGEVIEETVPEGIRESQTEGGCDP